MPQAAYNEDDHLPELTLAQMLAYVTQPGEYYGQTDAGAMIDLWDVKTGRVSLGDLGGGLKNFFKKAGKVLKKIAKVALPVLTVLWGLGAVGVKLKIASLSKLTKVKALAKAGKIAEIAKVVTASVAATGTSATKAQIDEATMAVYQAALQEAGISPGLPVAAVPATTAAAGAGAPVTMETLKQYAPWIAGGVVLLVLMMKK